MANASRRTLAAWLVCSLLFTGCGTLPPVPDLRPVERVEVAVSIQPQIEWEVKTDRNLGGSNMNIGGAAAGCVATGPFVVMCLAVVLPIAAAAAGATEALVRGRHERAPETASDQPDGVRVIDVRELADGFGVQAQVERAISGNNWKVATAGPVAQAETSASGLPRERVLRLEVQLDKIKALSAAPIRNLWIHEMHFSWQLFDPFRSGPVERGGFVHERVLSFSMRYDEATRRWIARDDGRFAADWARASGEIAGRVAERAVPAIAAFHRDGSP
jgi:hypothetical protein